MAAVTYRDHLPANNSAIDVERFGLMLVNAVSSMIAMFKAEQSKLQARQTLHSLSDVMLADIGVERSEINTITK